MKTDKNLAILTASICIGIAAFTGIIVSTDTPMERKFIAEHIAQEQLIPDEMVYVEEISAEEKAIQEAEERADEEAAEAFEANVIIGQPDAKTTGDHSGVERTIHEGDMVITTPGAVIEHMEIRGFVTIKAPNVVIKNSAITGRELPPESVENYSLLKSNSIVGSVTVQDTDIYSKHRSLFVTGVSGHDFTLERVNIHSTVDNVSIHGDNVLIRDSYIHNTIRAYKQFSDNMNRSYDDSIQIHKGRNIMILGNTIDVGHSSGVLLTEYQGPVRDVQIEGNWIDGGVCSVRVEERLYDSHSNVAIDNNIFMHDKHARDCAIYATKQTAEKLNVHHNIYSDGAEAKVTFTKGK